MKPSQPIGQQADVPKTGTDVNPAAPTEWRSPTMLTPEELESLRQEAKRSSEWIRAILAARRAKP